MKLKELGSGQLAIMLTGAFKGEIFYCNVMGIHSITKDRYWPSEYAKSNTRALGAYIGPVDDEIELIDKDRLKHLAPTVPVVEVIEVGSKEEKWLIDYIIEGSSVAKLLYSLQLVDDLKKNNAKFGAVNHAQEVVYYHAKDVYFTVTYQAMYELSKGHDRRVSMNPALGAPYKLNQRQQRQQTVRDFIRSVEEVE